MGRRLRSRKRSTVGGLGGRSESGRGLDAHEFLLYQIQSVETLERIPIMAFLQVKLEGFARAGGRGDAKTRQDAGLEENS